MMICHPIEMKTSTARRATHNKPGSDGTPLFLVEKEKSAFLMFWPDARHAKKSSVHERSTEPLEEIGAADEGATEFGSKGHWLRAITA